MVFDSFLSGSCPGVHEQRSTNIEANRRMKRRDPKNAASPREDSPKQRAAFGKPTVVLQNGVDEKSTELQKYRLFDGSKTLDLFDRSDNTSGRPLTPISALHHRAQLQSLRPCSPCAILIALQRDTRESHRPIFPNLCALAALRPGVKCEFRPRTIVVPSPRRKARLRPRRRALTSAPGARPYVSSLGSRRSSRVLDPSNSQCARTTSVGCWVV